MKSLLYYLIQVIACSGILYGYYHFFLRNKKFHAYNRFYLLAAATISILIPFLDIPVYFTPGETKGSFVLETITSISSNGFSEAYSVPVSIKNNSLATLSLVCYCYILISATLIVRILFSIEKIRRIKKKYIVQKLSSIYFVNTDEPGTPFSFFKWLFWNRKIELTSEKGEQIFRHELFHIEQRHSLDILYMELLTTIFWINPFLHLVRKEVKVIHEFLADQFAINQSKKWEYAELLLMQSLNTQQCLTNPFFYNQIKRRIAMITSSKKTSYQYLRKIMVLPVAIIVLALFAFSYKNKKGNVSLIRIEKPVTVVIDAGHGVDPSGTHTGVEASDGSHEDDIVLSIAKKIKELNTNERLQIILTRENRDIVDLKKRIEFSNSKNADLFISLHTNAASGQEKNAEGMDILISGKNTKYYAENKILATILYNYFHQIHPVNDIQRSKEGIYVVDNSHCPAVLVECGYLTDPEDLAFLKDENDQEKMAKSILQSIEQYFLQKEMPDWEQRKKVVSDTTPPVIKLKRNTATGKMEGSYNGKGFNKIADYDGQFAVLFDDDSSTMILISKEQTESLKKQYGKSLDELIIKDPYKWNSEKTERSEFAKSEKEYVLKQEEEQKQLERSQKEHLIKEQAEQAELQKSKREFLLKKEEEQKQLERSKKEYLLKEQKEHAQLEKSKKEFLIKHKEERQQLEKSEKEYLIKEQKEQAQLEKSKKEFLIKQQEDQKQLEKAQKEYLLRQQKEQAQSETEKKS